MKAKDFPKKIYLQENTTTVCYDEIWLEWFEASSNNDDVEYIRKDALMALLDAEYEETGIGLNEWENGVEHGRMDVISSLKEKIKAL